MKKYVVLLLAAILTCIYPLMSNKSYAGENENQNENQNQNEQNEYTYRLSITTGGDGSFMIDLKDPNIIHQYEHDAIDLVIRSDNALKPGDRTVHQDREHLIMAAGISNDTPSLLVRYPSLLRFGWRSIDGCYQDGIWWNFADANVYINENAVIDKNAISNGRGLKPGKYYLYVAEYIVITGPVEFEIPASAEGTPVEYKQELSVIVKDDDSLDIHIKYPDLTKYFGNGKYGIEIYKNSEMSIQIGSAMPDNSAACVMKWSFDASDMTDESYSLSTKDKLKPGGYYMYLTDIKNNTAIIGPVEFEVHDKSKVDSTPSPENTPEITETPEATPAITPEATPAITSKATKAPADPTAVMNKSVSGASDNIETTPGGSGKSYVKKSTAVFIICVCAAAVVGSITGGIIIIKRTRNRNGL